MLEEVAVLEEMGLKLTEKQRQFVADLWVLTMEESPVEVVGLEVCFADGCTLRFKARKEEESF